MTVSRFLVIRCNQQKSHSGITGLEFAVVHFICQLFSQHVSRNLPIKKGNIARVIGLRMEMLSHTQLLD